MSRDYILNSIRFGLGRGEALQSQRNEVMARIKTHKTTIIPKRSKLGQADQIQLFREMASKAAAQIVDLNSLTELPNAVARWLQQHNLSSLVSASDECFSDLDWTPLGAIHREERIAKASDVASLTTSMAGIAETGTLMLYSRPESPTTLNFLPDCHLVLLKESNIVGSYENAWTLVRKQNPDQMPRTVNLITGPSRSADIGQKLQMGAHGPSALIIFILKDV